MKKQITFHLENGAPVTLTIDTEAHNAFAKGVSEALRSDGSLSKDASARLEREAYALGLAFYEKASALVRALRYDFVTRLTA